MTNSHKVGLVFGALLCGFHALWSVLVFFGVAQAIYDFILWAHMIHLPIIIGPFDVTAVVTLLIMTAVMGYVGGYAGSKVWNRFHR